MDRLTERSHIQGLVDHHVVQRDTVGSGTVRLTGDALDAPREIGVQTPAGLRVVDWQPVGVAGGLWSGSIEVPVGGPYDLVVRRFDGAVEAIVGDFLVGDLWVLVGQSNMQGIGRLGPDQEQPSPAVHVLDLTRRWRMATEPLHRLFDSPDLAHYVFEDPAERAMAAEADRQTPTGAGLGIAFGKAMVASTGVPVGLVAAAQGGTSLAQWSPDLRDEGGNSLFGSLLLSLGAAGGRIAGVLWYQGESDALDGEAEALPERLRAFVDALRGELDDHQLPFFHVQIGCVGVGVIDVSEPAWMVVREGQRVIDLGPGGRTTAIDLGLDDFIHISTLSLRRLGRRLAALATGQGETIDVESVEPVSTVTVAGESFTISVRFRGVTGRLMPVEHIAGFSVRDGSGADQRRIYAARVDPDDGSTVILDGVGSVDGLDLWYGFGLDPHCNLIDGADLGAPAFGPWPLRLVR